MTRKEAAAEVIAKKKAAKLTWADIAKVAGAHEVWVTSVLLGQNSMPAEMASKVKAALGLSDEAAALLCECPMKGALDKDVVADPLIYRFHEITQVYGTTIKEIIHEKFGDGIMSAIDFTMDISRQADPHGDRVVIVMNGKFLPYKKW